MFASNGVREKAPGHNVKTGDVLTIGLDRGVPLLKVIGFAERRAMRPRRACSMSFGRIGRSNYLYPAHSADAGRPEAAKEAALLPLRPLIPALPTRSELTRFGALDTYVVTEAWHQMQIYRLCEVCRWTALRG